MFLATARFGANEFQENVVAELGDLCRKERVVLQTSRGIEVGRIETPTTPAPRGANFPHFAKVLRRATQDDLSKQHELEFDSRIQAHKKCAELIEKHKLRMRLVYVELLLGGDKAFFYFLSEDRIDFRDLVKDLAGEFHTRIELRHIGEREAARFLGDYQNCGQKLCCKTFLKKLPPVSMGMARNQMTTLDPGKLAGQCGKLKCCLRYEDSVYTELKKTLPERGTLVITDGAQGEVIGLDIYNQKVTLATPEGPRVQIGAHEIKEVRPGERGAPRRHEGGGEKEDDTDESGRRPPQGPTGPGGSGRPQGQSGPGRPQGQGGQGGSRRGPGPSSGPNPNRPAQGPRPAPKPPGNDPALNELSEPPAVPVVVPSVDPDNLLIKLLRLRSEPAAAKIEASPEIASAGGSCSTGGCSSGGCGSGGCSSGGCGCSTKARPKKQPSLEEFYRLRAPAFSRT